MIGENKYNGQAHTFVAEQLINEYWNDLSMNNAATSPVTLGTDDWYVTGDEDLLQRRPFFNRVGFGVDADITNYFYKNDRIYINDLTILCNFADGLVKNSYANVSPVPFAQALLPNALTLPDYTIVNNLKVRITTFYMTATGLLSAATLDLPIPHFNTVNNLGIFAPELPGAIAQTNVCQWLEIEIIYDQFSSPKYSTKSINTDFQADRAIVWAEATLSHTFATADYDAVTAGATQTNWPD